MTRGNGDDGLAAEAEFHDRVFEILYEAREKPSDEQEAFVRARAAGDDRLVRRILWHLADVRDPHTNKADIAQVADLAAEHSEFDREVLAAAAADRDRIGSMIAGKYHPERMLGYGGMGTVWEVTHTGIGRSRALKILNAAAAVNPEMRERFFQEASALGRLDHPNVVTVFDSGELSDHTSIYIEMELLAGRSLADRIHKGPPLAIDEAVEIGRQVLAGLDASHRAGIIHRDIKPGNIFLCDGKKMHAKVLDFGIAKLITEGQAKSQLTLPGSFIGTPSYMSSERVEGVDFDHRSDLFSVGVVLYEMIAGFLPFSSEKAQANGAPDRVGPVPPLDEVNEECPAKLARVIERLLERNAEDRYSSAEETALALSRAMELFEGFGAWDGAWEDVETPAEQRRRAVADQREREALEQVARDRAETSRRRRRVATRYGLIGVSGGLLVWLLSWAVVRPTAPVPEPAIVRSPAVVRFERNLVAIPGGDVTVGLDPQLAATVSGEIRRDSNLSSRAKEIFAPSADEMPAHAISLAPYFIALREVTRGEYAEFVAATGRDAPRTWGGKTPPPGSEDLPVTHVSWNDSVAYAAWLAERDQIPYRLPTEAEWEHAARGLAGNIWPWGNTWEARRAYADLLVESPMPVSGDPTATQDRSPFGVTGLAGNVSEWTSDHVRPYPRSTQKLLPMEAEMRIFRGGRFSGVPDSCRTTFRQWLPADTLDARIGFRLASSPPPSN